MADEALFSRYLPEDLISNILLRLPIRSLLVCTSISKPWNSFIKSSAFISSHLNHNISSRKENDSDLCLLQICSVPVEFGTDIFFLQDLEMSEFGTDSFFLRSKDREMSEYDRLQFPFPADQFGYQVVSSCNGLVYLAHGRFYDSSPSRPWILWNPSIRKTMVISESHNARDLEASGLGFDSKTGDFKLVSIVEEPWRYDNLRVNLYSLKANSWKRLPDLNFALKKVGLRREMAFVNGVLHFVGKRSYNKTESVILGFDLADEVFHEIMLPEWMANRFTDHLISTCGETLSVSCSDDISNIEIWVMKEYGVEGSWTKVSTVRLGSLPVWMDYQISGFLFEKDSHVLLSTSSYYTRNVGGKIFLHDLKTQETKEIEIGGTNAYCYLGNYVESLVLIGESNEEKPSQVEIGTSGDDDSVNKELLILKKPKCK